VFGVAHVKFERARSIHLQASNHRGPAAAGASPVSVLTSTQQGATASRADRQIFRRSTDSPAQAKKKKNTVEPHDRQFARRLPRILFWPGRCHGYPIARRATEHHTTPDANLLHKEKEKENRTSLHFRSPGLAPSSVPAFAAALHEPCLPMSVASVAALRTAGSGRRRGAGSQQTGLNGECLRLCQVRETLSNRI
jgi:hypothetical protein